MPPSELVSIAVDLPHLNFTSNIVGIPKMRNKFQFENQSHGSELNISNVVKKILDTVRTKNFPRIRGYPFTRHDNASLARNPWMLDTTADLIITWINCIENKGYSPYRILSACIVTLAREAWKSLKRLEPEDDKDKAKSYIYIYHVRETANSISRWFKTKPHYLYENLCLFLVNNISNTHWNLIMVCNLKTIFSLTKKGNPDELHLPEDDQSPEDEESKKFEFSEFAPPFIILSDSMHTEGSTNISSDTENVINMLRFWLSHDISINPSSIEFNQNNLPVFILKSTKQTDVNSCGYFVFRNIIGILRARKHIFPIQIKHLFKNVTNKEGYFKYIKRKKGIENRRISIIEHKHIMLYTAESVQVDFRQEVLTLIDRMKVMYDKCLSKETELEKISNDQNNMSRYILATVVKSCSIVSSSAKHQSCIDEEKLLYDDLHNQLKEFFTDIKRLKINNDNLCFCPGPSRDSLSENDPHQLPPYTFTCNRTKTLHRGFNFEEERTISQSSEDDNYIKDYLARIANGCSMYHTQH